MKKVPMLLGLAVAAVTCGPFAIPDSLMTASALESSEPGAVKVNLDKVSVIGSHTNVWFFCVVTISNGTSLSLVVTNLYSQPPGLSLRIMDSNGKDLKRIYAAPFKKSVWTIAPHVQGTDKLSYGFGGWRGRPSVSLSKDVNQVRLQIEGTMAGSSYTNRIASNVIEAEIP